jgi:hypothetical protein
MFKFLSGAIVGAFISGILFSASIGWVITSAVLGAVIFGLRYNNTNNKQSF